MNLEINKRNQILIRDASFMWRPNMSGNPERDNFGSPLRRATIIVDDEAAEYLGSIGVVVKTTNPREDSPYADEFVPKNYVTIQAKYHHDPTRDDPEVYLCVNGVRNLLPEDGLCKIDKLSDKGAIERIDLILNTWARQGSNTTSLYVDKMYVVQDVDTDPFAAEFEDA